MKHFTLALMAIAFISVSGQAQTVFWSDDFEDTGSPSSGTRVAETDAGTGDIYFKRTDGSDITTVESYTSVTGSKFWAGEDHGDVVPPGEFELQIEFNDINITGLTNLKFTGKFAANDFAVWESLAFASHDDYIIVEYRIDNGTYQPVIRFYANNGTSKQMAEETNGDNLGEGMVLTHDLEGFTKDIPATGSEIDLRIRVYTNGTNEEWAIDNFRLLHTSCTAPSIGTQPANSNVCEGGETSFSVGNITNGNGYRWQVDTGSGFNDIAEAAPYSGVYTSTLTISDVPGSMDGYQYRCMVINNTPECFTNSNAATLSVTAFDLSTSVDANIITAEQDGADYQWIDCADNQPVNGATSQSFTPTENGSYAVLVTLGNCSDTSDCVNITSLNIDELNSWNATLYPNPSNGKVTIDWGIDLPSVRIEVMDITGKIVQTQKNVFGSSSEMELKGLNGVYYVRVLSGEKSVVLKLVVG